MACGAGYNSCTWCSTWDLFSAALSSALFETLKLKQSTSSLTSLCFIYTWFAQMFPNESKVSRDLVFPCSTVKGDMGLGRRMALLPVSKSSTCSEDDLSVGDAPQLLTTYFLNFQEDTTPLVRAIECCHGKGNSAPSCLRCGSNYLSGSCR